MGLALWAGLSPLYDRVVAAGAEAVIRSFENPRVTRLRMAEDRHVRVDRSDFDPRSPRPAIRVYDLTFNFVLLTALFAAARRTFSDRNVGGFFAASALLALTHILGTVAEVMSIYVAKLGPWSRAHYSDLERHIWGVADHSYKVVLMFAFVFALWWMLRDTGTEKPVLERKARRPARPRGKR
ncbi:MAG TPA: hypothetical protein VF701_06115 [Thermoanaerobaculia bacterium]